MGKYLITLVIVCAALSIQGSSSFGASLGDEHQNLQHSAGESVNPVIQWNKTLLIIVRTPGAQPATAHPTRSFAIMHAAIYDAVNAIDRTHKPYLVRLTRVSRFASQDAAAASAAHEILVALYPTSRRCLTPNSSSLWLQSLKASIKPKVPA